VRVNIVLRLFVTKQHYENANTWELSSIKGISE